MAGVTTTFGAKSTMTSGINQAKQQMRDFRQAVAKEARAMKAELSAAQNSGGGGWGTAKQRRAAFGNFGNQIADIAVQAEQGTSALRILGQQGSQILGAFGTKGAIVGGAIAIGAGIVSAAMEWGSAFRNMIADAQEWDKEMGKIIKTGSISEITDAIGKAAEQRKKLAEGIAPVNADGPWQRFKGAMGALVGGDSRAEQQSAYIKEEGEQFWNIVKAQQRIITLSEREVKLSDLRAAGKEEEADKLKRQYDLEDKLANIRTSGLAEYVKEQLESDELRKAANEERIAQIKIEQKEQAKLQKIEEAADRKKMAASDRITAAQEEANRRALDGLNIAEKTAYWLKEMDKAKTAEAKGNDVEKHEARARQAEVQGKLDELRGQKIEREMLDPKTKSQIAAEERRAGRRRHWAERVTAGKERDRIDRQLRNRKITPEQAEEMRKALRADKKDDRVKTPEEQILADIKTTLEKMGQKLKLFGG